MSKRGFTIRDNKIITDEDRVHRQVVEWLKLKWPNVLFHTDAAGELMMESMRMRQGLLNLKGISWPDLDIREAHRGYFGMLIEMKREGEQLRNATGLFKNEHLNRQNRTLELLNDRNYLAVFAKGFDEIICRLQWYLEGPPTKIPKHFSK